MARVVTMPRQGNTVESCVLVGWHRSEGAEVASGDILCDVETDKAVFEVPAGADGVVLKLLVAEGDDVPVLAPIAVIGRAGEDWRTAVDVAGEPVAASPHGAAGVPSPAPSAAAAPAAKAPASPGQTPGLSQGVSPGVSPRARSLAEHEAIDARSLAGSGPGGRVIERDVLSALRERPPLSAAARAALLSGAPAPISGSGPGGRALLADVEAASSSATAPVVSVEAGIASSRLDLPFPGQVTETPLRSIRKVIADRMRESLATTAQYTLHASAPATRLEALRARMRTAPEALGFAKVTVGDLVLFAVSRVLKQHPNCNAHKVGEVVRVFGSVHLGLAVDTPRGLMVPVIRNADLLGLEEISREAKRLAAACVEGRANPDELSGSTFTVSNLGALGVDYFTPVINAPEVCVLGVGAILPKPFRAEDGAISLAPAIGLSLTSDHQVVDGAPGARLLRDLVAALADIDLWVAK